ncbi:MBL fold metallo-hydrolase [Phragmitibacter flavus]|nr:MBL fold metallo-hydrolase [Phragmitibacter flavus]
MNPSAFSRRRLLAKGALALSALSLIKAQNPTIIEEVISARSNQRQHHLCMTCGTQFPATFGPPKECPICLDERQYVGLDGQQWTTLEKMRRGGWRNVYRGQGPNLIGIGTEPKFGIGQRALLLRTPQGNVLWDCISYLDEQTVAAIQNLGGISAIAISHPHYYTSMIEWSQAFGNAPVYLHESDRQWVIRPDKCIEFWSGETKSIGDGLTLLRTGGHFVGFQVLHWRDGAGGGGALLAGDQPQVAADRNWVSFMYSYPNFIPLNRPAIERIVRVLAPYEFDRLYGPFWQSIVSANAKEVVKRSADRYLKAIRG